MGFLKWACTACALLVLASCSNIEVIHTGNEAFAAANYQYYSWRSEPVGPATTPGPMDLTRRMDPLIRAAVDDALADHGYQLNPEKAQFSVDYLFAAGLVDGAKSELAYNVTTRPAGVANRSLNQAEVDNAFALAGVMETSNFALQFNDTDSRRQVWRVVITKIVEDMNLSDAQVQSKVSRVISRGLRDLPDRQL